MGKHSERPIMSCSLWSQKASIIVWSSSDTRQALFDATSLSHGYRNPTTN